MLNQEFQGQQIHRQTLISFNNSRELQYSQSICNSQPINIQSTMIHKEKYLQNKQQHTFYFDDPITFQSQVKDKEQQTPKSYNCTNNSSPLFLNEANSNIEIELACNEKSFEIILARRKNQQIYQTNKSIFQQQRCFDSDKQLRSSDNSYYKILTQKLIRLSSARIQLEETQFLENQLIHSEKQINSQSQQSQSIQQYAQEDGKIQQQQCEQFIQDLSIQPTNEKQTKQQNLCTEIKQEQQNPNHQQETFQQIYENQKRSSHKSSSSASFDQKSQENQTNDNNQFEDDISNPIEMHIPPTTQSPQNIQQQVSNSQNEQLLSIQIEASQKTESQNKIKTSFHFQTHFIKPQQIDSIKSIYDNFKKLKQYHLKSYKLHKQKMFSQNSKEKTKRQKIEKILKYQLHPIHTETMQIISYY